MITQTIKQGKTIKVKKLILGRDIVIKSDSIVFMNGEGYSINYFEETIEIIIGIGKDNTASLIMSGSAWEALKNGEKINIE